MPIFVYKNTFSIRVKIYLHSLPCCFTYFCYATVHLITLICFNRIYGKTFWNLDCIILHFINLKKIIKDKLVLNKLNPTRLMSITLYTSINIIYLKPFFSHWKCAGFR